MYAIIQTGGKQYRVQPGDIIRVEKLDQDLGSTLEIKEVLFVGGDTPVFGQPHVDKASVTAVITRQDKHKKILIFKKKRRQGYRRMQGHRQPYTELFVKAITFNGQVAKASTEAQVVDAGQFKADRFEARTEKRREKVKSQVGMGKVARNKPESVTAAPKKKTAKKAKATGTAKKTKKVAKKATAKKKTTKK